MTESHNLSSIYRVGAFLLTCGLCLTAACGGAQTGADTEAGGMDVALAGAPDWVSGDCRNTFRGQAVLCGVGSVSGVASPSLARNTAMARGRTEIARFLQIQVKSVLTDYQAAKGGVTEQQIEDESQQIAEMTLSGTRMAQYFIGKDGTYYALMALELGSFQQTIAEAQNLDEPLKQALVENAKKSFSSRDSEVSRY
jgi:hypothetical protein